MAAQKSTAAESDRTELQKYVVKCRDRNVSGYLGLDSNIYKSYNLEIQLGSLETVLVSVEMA